MKGGYEEIAPKEASSSSSIGRTFLTYALNVALVLFLFGLVWFILSRVKVENQNGNGQKTNLHGSELENPIELDYNTLNAHRRQFISNMTLEAWNAYVKYAWGKNEMHILHQNTKGINDTDVLDYLNKMIGQSGLTIVDSLSTLWMMGHHDQYQRGREWVKTHLNFSNISRSVNVFESVTQYIGSMMSCYALTGDVMFLEKARQVADSLEPAYSSSSGFPFSYINPKWKSVDHWGNQDSSTVGSSVMLEELAGQQLEYEYLAYVTKLYGERVQQLRDVLKNIGPKRNGLYAHYYEVFPNGELDSGATTLSDGAFYFNLVKSYIQTNGTNTDSLRQFQRAMMALEKAKVFTKSRSGLTYVRDVRYSLNSNFDHYEYGDSMTSDTCYVGAMLALGSETLLMELNRNENETVEDIDRQEQMDQIVRYGNLAKELTETCHQASVRSRAGLIPFEFYFNERDDANNSRNVFHRNHIFRYDVKMMIICCT
ncbi:hypothetical protein RDWZM_003624 [Blomia tropicalis]|uniref:alpha-1,2-Mannosidase n=1 Tax=Blomia tropicalis TaxID=40697 RepID=A0A9Q0MGG8_BLOTA|nr:hypothetical protein RDWZM_003624 [Blomia tropicalis]